MYSKKEYELKIDKVNENHKKEVDSMKVSSSKLRSDNKYLRKRVKELTAGRDSWKNKSKCKQLKIKNLKAQVRYTRKTKYLHYENWLINLCVQLRIRGNCSYQSICKILLILKICFNLECNRFPCANTIQNWVSKVGLNRLQSTDNELHSRKVTLIIDENIRLGNEKLLLILSVDWEIY